MDSIRSAADGKSCNIRVTDPCGERSPWPLIGSWTIHPDDDGTCSPAWSALAEKGMSTEEWDQLLVDVKACLPRAPVLFQIVTGIMYMGGLGLFLLNIFAGDDSESQVLGSERNFDPNDVCPDRCYDALHRQCIECIGEDVGEGEDGSSSGVHIALSIALMAAGLWAQFWMAARIETKMQHDLYRVRARGVTTVYAFLLCNRSMQF